jgi:CCR4-NOT transcription complex subunit 6
MEMNLGSGMIFVISMLFLVFSLHSMMKKINEHTIHIEKKQEQKKEKNISIVKSNMIENGEKSQTTPNLFHKISILSYNILSQKFAKLNKRLCQENIDFDNRLRFILREITDLNSDIICLQEVNIEVLNQFFMRPLITFGYSVYYGKCEGSTFLNLIAFKSVEFRLISFKNLNLTLCEHSNLFIGNRGVFKVEILHKKTNQIFVVYNVHFPWRPHLEYIKCVILNIIMEDTKIQYTNRENVIICGDFNSLPNSLVMKLMYYDLEKSFFSETKDNFINNKCTQEGDKSQRLFYQILRQKKERESFEKILNNMEQLSNKFRFRSAYENYQLMKRNIPFSNDNFNYLHNHPQFTNFTGRFCGNIDYIFYSQSLSINRILNLICKEDLKNDSHLPSLNFPSDHLKIYAEFLFK